MNLSPYIHGVLKSVKSNSPEILTALGVSGVLTTAYLTGKASFQVAKDEDADPWASNKEKIKKYWKLYIPPAVSGVVAIGCIIAAQKSNARRTAAAVTAYSVAERAFGEYKEKVVEQIGKGKEQKIRDELTQEKVAKDTSLGQKEVLVLGSGHVLCCELFTRRYFRSDMETLRKAKNDINARIVQEAYITLDDFYDVLGIPHTSHSGNIGWDSNRLMDLEFSTVLSENGEPCLAFDYNYTKPL